MINNLIVDIGNDAIRKSGQDGRIASVDENSNLADLIRSSWDSVIKFMYASHPWAFKVIKAQADLRTIQGDPIAQQGMNVYAYPANALRIMGFYRDRGFQIRDDKARVSSDKDGKKVILSFELPLFIEFILDATSNDNISPWLREAITLKLAMEIARAKGRDIRLLAQEYTAMLDAARENNATESETHRIENDEYINARG